MHIPKIKNEKKKGFIFDALPITTTITHRNKLSIMTFYVTFTTSFNCFGQHILKFVAN